MESEAKGRAKGGIARAEQLTSSERRNCEMRSSPGGM